jgi:hypothetical protein
MMIEIRLPEEFGGSGGKAGFGPDHEADLANERIDAALLVRCDAHDRRRRGEMTVHEYLVALEWARWVENNNDPIRRAAGYTCSRAWEVVTARTDYVL